MFVNPTEPEPGLFFYVFSILLIEDNKICLSWTHNVGEGEVKESNGVFFFQFIINASFFMIFQSKEGL